MSDTPPPPIFRLVSAYSGAEPREKLSVMIGKDAYDYFFRHILAGDHGARQAIASIFFKKFHEHVRDVVGILPVWEPGPHSESLIAQTLSFLNFHDNSKLLERIAQLERELADSRANPSGRRSDPGAPLSQPKPSAPKRKRGGAGSDSPQSPDVRSDASEGESLVGNKRARKKTSL